MKRIKKIYWHLFNDYYIDNEGIVYRYQKSLSMYIQLFDAKQLNNIIKKKENIDSKDIELLCNINIDNEYAKE